MKYLWALRTADCCSIIVEYEVNCDMLAADSASLVSEDHISLLCSLPVIVMTRYYWERWESWESQSRGERLLRNFTDSCLHCLQTLFWEWGEEISFWHDCDLWCLIVVIHQSGISSLNFSSFWCSSYKTDQCIPGAGWWHHQILCFREDLIQALA